MPKFTVAHKIECRSEGTRTIIKCKSPIGLCGLHSMKECKKCHMAFTVVEDLPTFIPAMEKPKTKKKKDRTWLWF